MDCQGVVFVVDDDRRMRDWLVMSLETAGLAARSFVSAREFHRFYRSAQPGCLVADVRLPTQTGLELYEQLLREGKRLPVIFTAAGADVSTAVAAMKLGAVEFLEKPLDRRTLSERVKKALALDAAWRRREAGFNAVADRIACLNARDRETLELILSGVSNKVMAARLFISERAVEMRRARIMQKVQVDSLAELIDLAVTHRVLAEVSTGSEV
ncbi:MAG TPA: response regulator [Pirellulales bacterium]|jgi:FixJ family two-component response regulator|nr:response regulator [Pirellulales bacterium]